MSRTSHFRLATICAALACMSPVSAQTSIPPDTGKTLVVNSQAPMCGNFALTKECICVCDAYGGGARGGSPGGGFPGGGSGGGPPSHRSDAIHINGGGGGVGMGGGGGGGGGGTASGPVGNGDLCTFYGNIQSENLSFVDSSTQNYHHIALDYAPGAPVGGCTSCGGQALLGGSSLDSLFIERRHRYRDMTQTPSSFGPGVFCNYDVSVLFQPNTESQYMGATVYTVEMFDPREIAPKFLVGQTNQGYQPTGIYVDEENQWVKDFRCYDANGNFVVDPRQAATGVLTNWPGYKYTFGIVNVGGNADNPTAWLRFDEGSGTTANDSSGNGNTGTLVNNPTWVAGESGDALNFASNYVTLGNPADLNIAGPITLAAWVKASSYQGGMQYEYINGQYVEVYVPQTIIIHGTESGGTNVFLNVQNNQFVAGCTDANGVQHTVSCGVSQGQSPWIHVAGVYDGQNWVIYQNGAEAASAASTVGAVTSTGNWVIGADGSGTTGYFGGSIDEVHIYNRALSAAEVNALVQPTILAGRLQSITDRNGYSTTVTYQNFTAQQIANAPDLQFQIDTVTDPYGRQAVFSYLAQQQSGRWVISQINFPNGHKAVYGYSNGQIASVAFDDGTQSTFNYGTDATSQCSTLQMFDVAAWGSHREKTVYLTGHTAMIDPVNNVINQSSSLIRMLVNGSNEVAFLSLYAPAPDRQGLYHQRAVYEGAGRVKITYGEEYAQFFQSWTLGDPTQGYYAISGTSESVYATAPSWTDFTGTPAWLQDSQGHQYDYTYDGDTWVTQKSYSDGSAEAFTYNGFKQVTRYQDRDLNVTLHTFDAQGNLLSREVGIKNLNGVDTHQPEYAKYQWTYYPAGNANQFLMESAVDANGNSTVFNYDTNHRLVSVVEPPDAPGDAQATTTISYDTASRVEQILDPMNRAVQYSYDQRDRVAKITYGDSSTERFIYGSAGSGNENLLVRQKDRNGVTTRFDYDAAGRVSTTTFAYSMMDQNDNETLITDPSVVVTKTCTYLNGTDLVSSCTERGETTSYGYDYRQRLVSTTVQPRVGVSLTSTRTYLNNLLFCETDPYGRNRYFGYRSSDGALIREIQGTVPSFTLADFTAVMNETRSATPNAQFLITDYQLDNIGQQIAIVDGNNNTLAQTFDSRGQLIQRVEASGTPIAATSGFLYDANGKTIEQRSPRFYDSNDPEVGNCRVQFTYTGRSLLATRTEAPGTIAAATIQYSYNLDRTQASMIDARNNTWQTLWSACCAGRNTGDLDPTSAGESIEYDYNGNPTFVQVVQGTTTYNQTTTQYDARRRPIFRTVWLTTAPAVDPNNPPIAGQNGIPVSSGLTTQWYYDEDLADDVGLSSTAGENIAGVGNVSIRTLLTEIQSDGITFGTGSDGYAVLELTPDGRLTVAVKDGIDRFVAGGLIQPPAAQSPNQPITWSTRFDDTVVALSSPGNLLETTIIDALNNTVRQRMDAARRLIQRVDPESNVTTMTFDSNSNQLSVADPNSVGYAAVFDARNRETSRTDTMNATTSAAFDANSNLVKSTDAKSNSSLGVFDARDRRISLTDRIGGTTAWSFDGNSNVVSLTDSGSTTTQFTFDPRNLKTAEIYADNNPPSANDQVTLVYDGAKRLQTRTDQIGDYVTMTWDMANRLTSREYRDSTKQPTDVPNDTDSFKFDGDSHMLTAVSGRYSNTLTFTYDQAGRMASEALTIGGQTYAVGRGYDTANRLVTISYPDGSIVAQTFTARNLLGQVDYQGSLAASFTYDSGGRRATRKLGDTPGTTSTWAYATGGNIIASISTPNLSSFTYTYDTNKNRAAESITGVLEPFGFSTGTSGYDNDDRLVVWDRSDGNDNETWTLTDAGDWSAFADASGRQTRTHNSLHELTAINGSALSYDGKGNLVSNGAAGASYVWDFDNQLSSAAVGGSTATFTYDALGRRATKTSAGNCEVYVQSRDDATRLAKVVAEYPLGATGTQPDRLFLYASYVDEVTGAISHGVIRYYHQDAQMSPRMITNADGSLAELYAYSPYGETTVLSPTGAVLQASTVGNSVSYTGRQYDKDTGLLYVRARYYDSHLGRFISRDPIEVRHSPNLFEYCGGNPIVRVDPSGQCPVIVIPIAGGVVVISAAEAAAAAFGLSVMACLTVAPCREAMYDAIEAAVQDLNDVAIELMRLNCRIIYNTYKAASSLCSRCDPSKGRTMCDRVARCAQANANSACWTSVLSGRLAYLLNGCDFVMENNAFEGHAKAAGDVSKALGKCTMSAANNCGILW